MASASWDPDNGQWIADFRGLGQVLKQRRRVRLDATKFPKKAKASAIGFAAECDRYCRTLEIAPQDPADVEHAARIKAITDQQSERLRADLPPGPATRPTRQWTLAEAAKAHPSTQRDERVRPKECELNLRRLEDFAKSSGIETVARMTLAAVLQWVAKLKADKRTREARRHRLLYLRRACKMGSTVGIPDCLAGLRIDHAEDGDALEIEAWTIDELARGVLQLKDLRAKVALALGGFCGLRSSECQRLELQNLRGDLLDVGARKAKNRSSKRTIPLPATVAGWCAELALGRKPEDPLIAAAAHRHKPRAFTPETWAHWLGPALEQATGRALPPKCLRKTFATWAPGVLAGRDVERYLGHQSAFLAQVSSTKYQADRAAEELRPAAKLIEQTIADAMTRARKAPHKGRLPHAVSTKSQTKPRQAS